MGIWSGIMSYQTYQNIQQRSETPRATEYRLFVEVTRALMEAKDLPVHDKKVIKTPAATAEPITPAILLAMA